MEEKILKNVMYIMIAVAIVLAGALAYIWWQKATLVNELTVEKEELTAQMIDLQNDYAMLSSDYDTINSQLDSSREEVSQLIERIKQTEATNRSKMRQYEKELGTLRTIMKSYIVQIDSLNTLNKKLTADAADINLVIATAQKEIESKKDLSNAIVGKRVDSTYLIKALFIEPNPMPVKDAMNILDMDVGNTRLPLIEVSSDTHEILKSVLYELKDK